MFYKIQFILLMLMQRIGEFGLVTLHDIEAILLRKTCNLCKNFCHKTKIRFFRNMILF